MAKKIVVIPGDGIGEEITNAAVLVLKKISDKFQLDLTFESHAAGGTAYDLYGTPLPEKTILAAKAADAVLFGAVGGAVWDNVDPALRPEKAILGLRKSLGLYANLRPIKVMDCLVEYSPLKKEIVSVLVLNQANVLTRVVSLFGRRGFNIDSLTVSATNNPELSRITIAFSATEQSMQQIITQTEKLEVVKSIFILDRDNSVYRELLLLKVNATEEQRTAIKEIVDIYRGKIVDLSRDSMIIELTGTSEKLDGFMDVMSDHDIVEVCRTGITGLESNAKPKNI